MPLRDVVEAGAVGSVLLGAGLAFGGLGLLVAGLLVVVACEVRS